MYLNASQLALNTEFEHRCKIYLQFQCKMKYTWAEWECTWANTIVWDAMIFGCKSIWLQSLVKEQSSYSLLKCYNGFRMEFKMKLESSSILELSTEKTQMLWNHDLLWSSYQIKKICAHDLILEESWNEKRALMRSIKRWWLWEFPCIALTILLTFVFC
jgi:hypothetical protein